MAISWLKSVVLELLIHDPYSGRKYCNFIKDNCPFRPEFPTNAYVFVFSIVPEYIVICLFPSMNYQMQKNAKKHICTFFEGS